jgi:hypothetical protein
MTPILVQRSSGLTVFALLLAMLMTTGGWWATTIAETPDALLKAWAGLFFFGAATIFLVFQLLHRRPCMVLNDEGVTDNRLNIPTIPWSDIAGATTQELGIARMVYIQLRDQEKTLAAVHPAKRALLESNRIFGGTGIAINVRPMSVSAEAICEAVRRQVGLG